MRLLLFNLATDAMDPILGFTTQWIWALAERVKFIHVITMRAGHVEVPGNVRVYSVGKEKGYNEPRRAVEFYRLLFQVLREGRIDVCFSHMMPIFTVLAAPVLRRKGIPIVTWYAHRQLTQKLKLAHHFSDRMVSINGSSYPYTHDKLICVGHGVNSHLFSPDTTALDNPPLLLSVGRLSRIKGLNTLLDALHLLRQRSCSVCCAFVGDAPESDRPYAEALRQKAQALNLTDSVEFVGAVPNHQVVQWYRRSLAHVNCSPPDHSLDKAVLEAMACAKPSLSSTLGFKETMGKWADRLLFQHGNPEDLAKKIEGLLRLTDAERQSMGISLRESVMQRHNLEQSADKLVALFSSLREPSVRTQRLAQPKFVVDDKTLQDQPLHGLTICYFGHYDPNYPRHRVLKKALQRAGAELVEVNDHSLGLARYLRLFNKSLRCHFDLMIVAFPSHTDMPMARFVCTLKRAPLIFDALISRFDTILDRQSAHPKSLTAKKAYWIDKMACQLADIILLDCQVSIRYFVEAFRLQEKKFRRLWVGADDDILRPCSYPSDNLPFTVFFTGTFIPLHGIEYIINAAKILEERGEAVRFVIVGSGQSYQKITAMASDLAVSNVQFERPVRYEQLSSLMSQAHLCLGIFGISAKAQHGIPSKVFFALATMRPVVTGDTPAMREIFTHGENIWLCPMGDAAALADSITELKQRPDLRAKIAERGHELFAREFSIEAIKEDIVSIVQEICGNWDTSTLPRIRQCY